MSDFNFSFNVKACQVCGAKCCRGESGNVFISNDEVVRIASFLNISTSEFIDKFCRKVGYKLSLKELKYNNEYFCVFLENNKCQIYPVRPSQCKIFPFWKEFKNNQNQEYLKNECIGVIFNEEN